MKLVEEFEEAVRNHEMRGAKRPEERPYIEAEYDLTKARLIAALKLRREITK